MKKGLRLLLLTAGNDNGTTASVKQDRNDAVNP